MVSETGVTDSYEATCGCREPHLSPVTAANDPI